MQADRKGNDHKLDQVEALKNIVVTKPEWLAYQDILRFDYVATAENAKAKGQPVPLRRKRCADAFVAQFKSGKYKSLPAACAYVDKETGE